MPSGIFFMAAGGKSDPVLMTKRNHSKTDPAF